MAAQTLDIRTSSFYLCLMPSRQQQKTGCARLEELYLHQALIQCWFYASARRSGLYSVWAANGEKQVTKSSSYDITSLLDLHTNNYNLSTSKRRWIEYCKARRTTTTDADDRMDGNDVFWTFEIARLTTEIPLYNWLVAFCYRLYPPMSFDFMVFMVVREDRRLEEHKRRHLCRFWN